LFKPSLRTLSSQVVPRSREESYSVCTSTSRRSLSDRGVGPLVLLPAAGGPGGAAEVTGRPLL